MHYIVINIVIVYTHRIYSSLTLCHSAGPRIVGARWAGVRRSSGPGSKATDLSSIYTQAIIY